jgi:hypothetical protein
MDGHPLPTAGSQQIVMTNASSNCALQNRCGPAALKTNATNDACSPLSLNESYDNQEGEQHHKYWFY